MRCRSRRLRTHPQWRPAERVLVLGRAKFREPSGPSGPRAPYDGAVPSSPSSSRFERSGLQRPSSPRTGSDRSREPGVCAAARRVLVCPMKVGRLRTDSRCVRHRRSRQERRHTGAALLPDLVGTATRWIAALESRKFAGVGGGLPRRLRARARLPRAPLWSHQLATQVRAGLQRRAAREGLGRKRLRIWIELE
jgi:hypothetical protein